MQRITAIELFAGAGGLALGMEQAGIEIKLYVENDKTCCETLKKNRPEWNVVRADVRNLHFHEYAGKIDLVTGGFPCQAFSIAGKRLGFDDARGTLFYEYARCIKEVRPKMFLAENVKGLLSHDNGRTFQNIISILTGLGYYVQYKVLNAMYYGVGQKRERLFIIGIRNDLDYHFEFPRPSGHATTLREVLKDCPESEGAAYGEAKKQILDLVPQGGCWVDLPDDVAKDYMGKSYCSGGGRRGIAKRLSWDEPCLTLTCSPVQKQTERCHPDETRPLTVREYARIQSFPDDWKFCGSLSEQYKQIGNAVPVELARRMGREIRNAFSSFTFIDLFAGIGGMRLAFENAGGRCIYSSEWNKFAQKTYEANFGEMPEGDITKVDAKDIPDHDILVAGFPCQPFSLAGKRKGFADETQGTLFFDVCRILKEKRPKAFLLENVKNLKSHDNGRTFRVILDSLGELGYEVFCKVLDGQHYVPQHRERIIIVGFDRKRYGGNIRFSFGMAYPDKKPVMDDILEDSVDDKYTISDKLWQYLQNHKEKHQKAGHGFGYGIASKNGISRTLSARYYKDGSEILIAQEGKNPRKLTPRECARLMGFPDSFKIPVSDTQAYRQFGNSVVVPMIENAAELIASKLEELDRRDRILLHITKTSKYVPPIDLDDVDDEL